MNEFEATRTIVQLAGFGDLARPEDESNDSVGGRALRILRAKSRELQTTGWHFNRIEDVELTPDAEGYVEVPPYYLWVDTYGTNWTIDVTESGSRLYDRGRNSAKFDAPVRVRAIVWKEWDCLPIWFRQLVVYEAAAEMIRTKSGEFSRGDELRYQHVLVRAAQARGTAMEKNMAASNVRAYKDGRLVRFIGTRFGPTRSSTR